MLGLILLLSQDNLPGKIYFSQFSTLKKQFDWLLTGIQPLTGCL